MVRHQAGGLAWWCLPGGAVEEGETPAEAALRELEEECGVEGRIVRQTSHMDYGGGDETFSFLVDIGPQAPRMGRDPDVPEADQVLAGIAWLRLPEIPERDRVFLWAAGLLGIPGVLPEVERWGDALSYPSGKDETSDCRSS
jgi:ADP-ribose pyrophosphatase YjhB (NUDIX family)